MGFEDTRCDLDAHVHNSFTETRKNKQSRLPHFAMTPISANHQSSLAMETSDDRGHIANASALLLAAQVFQTNGAGKAKELSTNQHENWDELEQGETEPTKSFLRRKVDAHIKKKTEKEREAMQRGMLTKVGEPMVADFIRINNNLSLQISRHTSRHSRYNDDSSTDADNDDELSFCDDSFTYEDEREVCDNGKSITDELS